MIEKMAAFKKLNKLQRELFALLVDHLDARDNIEKA